MRLCRFQSDHRVQVGFFVDEAVLPLENLFARQGETLPEADWQSTENVLLDLLPGGKWREQVSTLEQRLTPEEVERVAVPVHSVKLLVPIPKPPKLLLLAGNYAKHVEERGDRAEERERTFPYVFMKPPSTTLTHPGDPIRIPACSPDEIDWELELGVIIGRGGRNITEADALQHVAGYTIVNDISDRNFRPFPQRVERSRDKFFDWLHGKWHDTFCPMGPCVLPATEVADPQQFPLQLSVNGELEQNSSTSEMVFPVAAVIAFISNFVTLEPGDIISTGTPDGVGKAKGKFLRDGDVVSATIGGIGNLENPVVD